MCVLLILSQILWNLLFIPDVLKSSLVLWVELLFNPFFWELLDSFSLATQTFSSSLENILDTCMFACRYVCMYFENLFFSIFSLLLSRTPDLFLNLSSHFVTFFLLVVWISQLYITDTFKCYSFKPFCFKYSTAHFHLCCFLFHKATFTKIPLGGWHPDHQHSKNWMREIKGFSACCARAHTASCSHCGPSNFIFTWCPPVHKTLSSPKNKILDFAEEGKEDA